MRRLILFQFPIGKLRAVHVRCATPAELARGETAAIAAATGLKSSMIAELDADDRAAIVKAMVS